MAAKKTSDYYMEKGAIFWQIVVNKNETISRGGKIGTKGRKFSTKTHKNSKEAVDYALKQISGKRKCGFSLKKEKSTTSRHIQNKEQRTSKPTKKTGDNESSVKTSTDKPKRGRVKASKTKLDRTTTVVLARDKSCLSPQEKRELLKRPSQFGNWSLSRIPSLTVGADELYIPSRNDWPVSIDVPVIWHCKMADDPSKAAYGIYVDDTKCLFGDESGRVVELDHEGRVVKIFHLHEGVKCIVKDREFLYVGCNDGGLYDLTSGEARLIYSKSTQFGQVCWLDVWHGYMAVSDENGQVAMIDHDGDLIWKKQSAGVGGWMVRVDSSGVYHGFCGGVCKYQRQDGTLLWTTTTEPNSSIYFGVQDSAYLFIAENTVIRKICKLTGSVIRTYQKEHCGEIMSNEIAPGMVIAGGDHIVCYDERTADTIYKLNHQSKPYSMQYHKGLLFCVGEDGLNVIDLSEEAIKSLRQGQKLEPLEVSFDVTAPVVSPLKRLESVRKQQSQKQILVQCVQVDKKLRIRPISKPYNGDWNCQFPVDIQKEGAVYVVEQLVPNEEGEFYRVYGTIQELEISSPRTAKMK